MRYLTLRDFILEYQPRHISYNILEKGGFLFLPMISNDNSEIRIRFRKNAKITHTGSIIKYERKLWIVIESDDNIFMEVDPKRIVPPQELTYRKKKERRSLETFPISQMVRTLEPPKPLYNFLEENSMRISFESIITTKELFHTPVITVIKSNGGKTYLEFIDLPGNESMIGSDINDIVGQIFVLEYMDGTGLLKYKLARGIIDALTPDRFDERPSETNKSRVSFEEAKFKNENNPVYSELKLHSQKSKIEENTSTVGSIGCLQIFLIGCATLLIITVLFGSMNNIPWPIHILLTIGYIYLIVKIFGGNS